MTSFVISSVPTMPIAGQQTGTSGLRKKVAVFRSPNYLHNWVQSLFTSLKPALLGQTIALGGDGRFWNAEAIQIILRLAAGNGVARVLVGHNGIMCTPAMSAVIRGREIFGGIILTASHNPGGPENDFGIKYNASNGGPASPAITDAIYEHTKTIKEYHMVAAPDGGSSDPFASIDLSKLHDYTFTNAHPPESYPKTFTVSVISSSADYVTLLESMFPFPRLRALLARPDFKFLFDAMNGVTGPYARAIFVDKLGADAGKSLMRCDPLPDFGGEHPDPNLTYAAELVARCDPAKNPAAPDMGAASDGDGDRNMILGKGFFVTPSDSVAVIAAYAHKNGVIPYFDKHALTGVARSMPTASALDHVAKKLGLECFEVPTGWKFFGNLMDAGRAQICGEESFGTGSDHVREKDGLFAVLCWLAILASVNEDASKPIVSIESIVTEHWKTYGRNYFSRYDYEEVDTEKANAVMAQVAAVQKAMNDAKAADGRMAIAGCEDFPVKVVIADDFSYVDPVDQSVAKKQGLRFVFEDHSRLIFRLSGTGSSGATIRMYVEKYESDASKQNLDAQVALKPFIELALNLSKLQALTGRDAPTVIT